MTNFLSAVGLIFIIGCTIYSVLSFFMFVFRGVHELYKEGRTIIQAERKLERRFINKSYVYMAVQYYDEHNGVTRKNSISTRISHYNKLREGYTTTEKELTTIIHALLVQNKRVSSDTIIALLDVSIVGKDVITRFKFKTINSDYWLEDSITLPVTTINEFILTKKEQSNAA